MCSCGLQTKATLYYLLRCNLYSGLRIEVLNDKSNFKSNFEKLTSKKAFEYSPV